MSKRARKSLSLRLQPYEGTPLAEIASYLNSLDRPEANQRVIDILTFLLPIARKYSGESTEEVEKAYWSTYATIERLFYLMAQELRIQLPQVQVQSGTGIVANISVNGNKLDVASVMEWKEMPVPQIMGKGTVADVDALFGD
ncbi:hypothetical protein [Floridanema evergladense]|uniref:Uncharacterized protein n=1 Tax=Floridaenema evergladense BLCC-F167 TaxID=3153639 RepID=A0ABV4WDF4_9CYAN